MPKKARPKHYNDLAAASKRTYGYYWAQYERTARSARVPVYAPGETFLESYLEREATISVRRARNRIMAIAYRFWLQGLRDPTKDLPIRRALSNLSAPARMRRSEMLGLMPQSTRRYAAYVLEGEYARSTRRAWEQAGHTWEVWAHCQGVNPQQPRPDVVVQYLRKFDRTSYANVVNRRNMLSHYFEDRHLPDVAWSTEANLFMEGRRRRPAESQSPLFIDDLRRIVAQVGEDVLDRRDHLVALFAFFGPFNASVQSRMNVEDILLVDGGLFVDVDGRQVYIDEYTDEPALDVVVAFQRYLATVPWRDGRLFRAMGLRNEYLAGISPGGITASVRRLAGPAGIRPQQVMWRLNLGCRLHMVKLFGTIPTAHRLGVTPLALASHIPAVRAELNDIGDQRTRKPNQSRPKRRT